MSTKTYSSSLKQFMYIGLLWCPICFTAIFIHKTTIRTGWADSALLLLPPMIVQLFFCLGTRFISRSNPIRMNTLIRVIFTHLIAAVILSGTWIVLIMVYSIILESITKNPSWPAIFRSSVPLLTGISMALYSVSVLFHYLLMANRAARKAENDALNQRLYAAQAELKVLKSTIHPHFLFNSLNTIIPLIDRDAVKSKQFVRQLSDFFRYSLKHGGEKTVAVSEELEHIRDYLAIEKIRLGDRLKTVFKIDESTPGQPVLSLILIPLIENAIKHGISQCLQGGELSITVQNDGDFLSFEVINPYEKPSRPLEGEGLGIRTLKQRLQFHYGNSARCITRKTDTVYTAKIMIPSNMEVPDGR